MSPVTVACGTMMDMLSIAREDAAARFDARQHTTESGDSSHVVISPRCQRRADALFVMGGRTVLPLLVVDNSNFSPTSLPRLLWQHAGIYRVRMV